MHKVPNLIIYINSDTCIKTFNENMFNCSMHLKIKSRTYLLVVVVVKGPAT